MPNLIVITFDNAEEASKVRKSIKESEKKGFIKLDDAAVVIKDANGKVEIKDELDRGVKVGALTGTLAGMLIGFMVGGPILSAVIGGAGGAGVGALTDLGIQKSFIKDVSDSIQPGTSALFIIVREAQNPDAAISALKPYKGEIYHTSLPPETEETLRRVLKKREQ